MSDLTTTEYIAFFFTGFIVYVLVEIVSKIFKFGGSFLKLLQDEQIDKETINKKKEVFYLKMGTQFWKLVSLPIATYLVLNFLGVDIYNLGPKDGVVKYIFYLCVAVGVGMLIFAAYVNMAAIPQAEEMAKKSAKKPVKPAVEEERLVSPQEDARMHGRTPEQQARLEAHRERLRQERAKEENTH